MCVRFVCLSSFGSARTGWELLRGVSSAVHYGLRSSFCCDANAKGVVGFLMPSMYAQLF